MSKLPRIGPVLPKNQRGSRGELDQPLLPLDDVSLRREREKVDYRKAQDKEAAPMLEAASGAYGQAKELAIDLEVTESYFSDMCSGERSTPLRALLVIKKNRRALVAFVDTLLEGTDLVVTKKRKVSKADAESSVARSARRIVQLWPVIRKLAAEDAETDEQDIEAALNAEAVDSGGLRR